MMGHPPIDDFVAGVHCAIFETTFGTTETPAKVKVVVEGMVKCPDAPRPPANGTFILTQGAACNWELEAPTQVLTWGLTEGGGVFLVYDALLPHDGFFFAPGNLDFYNNTYTCPFAGAEGGTATITWGPEIPKL